MATGVEAAHLLFAEGTELELNYFKDIFFDLINEWYIDIADIREDYPNGLL